MSAPMNGNVDGPIFAAVTAHGAHVIRGIGGNASTLEELAPETVRGQRVVIVGSASRPGAESQAARRLAAIGAVPCVFPETVLDGCADLADLIEQRGTRINLDALASCAEPIEATKANARLPAKAEYQPGRENATGGDPGGQEWDEPEPLGVKLDALPYPTDALPSAIRSPVEEVHDLVQAPVALVACSALAALSAAAQGLANVRRDAQLVGPTSVYILAVADSGERKTSCDDFFSRPLREWERDTAAAMVADVTRVGAERTAFAAKRAGIEDAIKRAARCRKDAAALEKSLFDLMAHAPDAVIVPRILFADATPEALAFELSRGWPCGAMVSAEAGAILGGHAMSTDTLMRNLALLNVLWDGGELRIDRRTKESFTIRGRRLTFGAMIQEPTLRDFIERARGLARGSGFLARFLMCWPASTQGTRAYRPAPERMPALEAFARRIRALLEEIPRTDVHGDFVPPELPLSAEARQAWIRFHDDVEAELADRGELRDVRDVASKAAENVARVAALLHIFESGVRHEISAEHVIAGGRIIAWHLREAQRLLGALDAPIELSNAIRLDAWMRAEARRTSANCIPTREIRRFGPYAVRQDSALSAALGELVTRQRARRISEGKRRFVEINPAILAEGGT